MSWDIFVIHLPAGIASIDEIPEDFRPVSLHRGPMIETIKRLYPSADFTDPAWGRLEGDGFSIEFNMGEAEEMDSFALHIRGGADVVLVIATILDALGLAGADPSSEGGIFSLESAGESLERWRAYRDQVVAEH